MINGLRDRFSNIVFSDKVLCLNCGITNPGGVAQCENCSEPLQKPAPLLQNAVETIFFPRRATPRIAATAPVRQAFLVVLLIVPVYLLLQTLSTISGLEGLKEQLDVFGTNQGSALLKEKNPTLPGALLVDSIVSDQRLRIINATAPVPGLVDVVTLFLLMTLSWIFFSAALFYTVKFIYPNDARAEFRSFLSITGFARLTAVFIPLALLPLPGSVSQVISIVILIWQLGLITYGVKVTTGARWGRAVLITMIPALIFYFFLNIPI